MRAYPRLDVDVREQGPARPILAPHDGYHRVWGRDLYQQATGLIAAGDSDQASRMAKSLWSSQFVGTPTPGDGTIYQPGSFPRYTPVGGIGAATGKDLGCCEQLDEEVSRSCSHG